MFEFDKKNSSVASILLNYNSNDDLYLSVKDLKKQNKTNHTIIIVDNNSTASSVSELKKWQSKHYPTALSGSVDDIYQIIAEDVFNPFQIIFVYNDKNAGYSAGNNIGIRIANKIGAEAVLIVNPDMRIKNKDYLSELVSVSNKDDKSAIVASRIIGVDGEHQSPMVADDFWREFLWPKQLFPKVFKQPVLIQPITSDEPVYVSKVTGCCMLIKMDFLKEIGFLDESTFLYSEEAILSAQVERLNKKIVFIPSLSVNHVHRKENKDNSSKRMLLMIESRLFYIKKFSKYNGLQRILLRVSYLLWYLSHLIKSNCK